MFLGAPMMKKQHPALPRAPTSPAGCPRWMNKSSKPATMVNNSLSISDKEGQVVGQSSYLVEDGVPNCGKGASKESEETVSRMIFQSKLSNPSLPTLSLWPTTESTSTPRTRVDHEFGHKNMSLALSADKQDTTRGFDFDLLREKNSNGTENRAVSNPYKEQKGIAVSRSGAHNNAGSSYCFPHDNYNHANGSSSGAIIKRNFPNDNFICLNQGHSKYHQFSTILFHEKTNNESRQIDGLRMQNDPSMNKNFLPFFCNKQSENFPGHSRRTSDIEQGKLSVHNVETMRICTMVDSVQNSPGGHPKISQRAHHFLFTKETCVNLSKENHVFREPNLSKEKMFGGSFNLSPDIGPSRPHGVKIQPLWSSTDSEDKENTRSHLTSKMGSRNELSAETVAMPKNQHVLSGMASSPSNKDDAVDENIPPAAFSSRTERSRSKQPITDLPDINEEIPRLQPAASSTDSMEPSTSRVHSLAAKHLFPCGEQTSRPKFNVRQDPPFGIGTESSNRWIKRLKLSSADSVGVGTKYSDMREASSHEKFSNFFNRIMKGNRPATVDPTLDQNMDPTSSTSSKKRDHQSVMDGGGCTWRGGRTWGC